MDEAQRRLNLVFMGTPAFASIILQKLVDSNDFEISAIYCQPDRASGRGRKIIPCAVKSLAQDKFNVYQPVNFKDISEIDILNSYQPDFLIVAAYGLILPQKILNIPKYAPLNVHASLLPLYRGAAPIQRAIWDNQLSTGVSIMLMEASLDTGPVYAQKSLAIHEHTSASMHIALAESGADLLMQSIKDIAFYNAKPKKQNESEATYAPKLNKSDGLIIWSEKATAIHAQIRAVTPWPNAQLFLSLPNNKIYQVQILPGKIIPKKFDAVCGSIWHGENNTWGIVALDAFYEIKQIKLNGKQMVSAQEFSRGYFTKITNAAWGRVLTSKEITKNV